MKKTILLIICMAMGIASSYAQLSTYPLTLTNESDASVYEITVEYDWPGVYDSSRNKYINSYLFKWDSYNKTIQRYRTDVTIPGPTLSQTLESNEYSDTGNFSFFVYGARCTVNFYLSRGDIYLNENEYIGTSTDCFYYIEDTALEEGWNFKFVSN